MNLFDTDMVLSPELDYDNISPIQRYLGSNNYALISCRLKFDMAMLSGGESELEEFTNCCLVSKSISKENLKKALETVDNVKAQEALKNYHVAVMCALKGISAGGDPLTMKPEQCQYQQALEDKVTEAWERFEIEL